MKNPVLCWSARLAVAALFVPALSHAQEVHITGQPRSQSLCAGEPVVLAVEIEGVATGFQWRRDGVPLAAQHERVLKERFQDGDIPTGDQFIVPGDYDCVIDCVGGPVISSVASVRAAGQKFGPWSVLHPYVQPYEWPPDGSLVVPGSDAQGAGEALLLVGKAKRCVMNLADGTRGELAASQEWLIDSMVNFIDDRELIGLRLTRNVGVNEVLPFAVLHAARASFYDSSSGEPVTVEWLQGGTVVATAACDYTEQATWTTSSPQRIGYDWSDPAACAAQVIIGGPPQPISVGGVTHAGNGIRFKRGTAVQQAAVAQLGAATAKHAINTKGTGATNGRIASSSARHAINTKGTGATNGRSIQFNYTAGGAGSPPDLRFSACTASYDQIDDDCDGIERVKPDNVIDEDCDLVITHEAPQPGTPVEPDISYTAVRRPLAGYINFCPVSGVHARSAGFSWGATQMGSGGGIKRCTLSVRGVSGGISDESFGTLSCTQLDAVSCRLLCDLDTPDSPVTVQLYQYGVLMGESGVPSVTLDGGWLPAETRTHHLCGTTDHFRVSFPSLQSCSIETSSGVEAISCDEVRFVRGGKFSTDRAIREIRCELEGIDAFTVRGTFSDLSTADVTADCLHAACRFGEAVVYCPPSSGAKMAINEKGNPIHPRKRGHQSHSRLSALLGQPGQLGAFPEAMTFPEVGKFTLTQPDDPIISGLRIVPMVPGGDACAVFGLPDCVEGQFRFALDATPPEGQVNTGSLCEIVTHAVVGITGEPQPVGEAKAGTLRIALSPPESEGGIFSEISCDYTAIQAVSQTLHLMNGNGEILHSVPNGIARIYSGEVFKTGHVTLNRRTIGPVQRCSLDFDSPISVRYVDSEGVEGDTPYDCTRIEFDAVPGANYEIGSSTGFSLAYSGGGGVCCPSCRPMKSASGAGGQVTGTGHAVGVVETRLVDGLRDDIAIAAQIEGESGGFDLDLGEAEGVSLGLSPRSLPVAPRSALSFQMLGKTTNPASTGSDPIGKLQILPPSPAFPDAVCTVECDFSDLPVTEVDVEVHQGSDVTTLRQATAVIGFACTGGPSSVTMKNKNGHVTLIKQRTAMAITFPPSTIVVVGGSFLACDHVIVRPVNDPPIVDYASRCVVTATGVGIIDCPWIEVTAIKPTIELLGHGGNLSVARSSQSSELFMSTDLLHWSPVVSPPSFYDPSRGDQAWLIPNPAVDAIGTPATSAYFSAQDDWRKAYEGQ